MSGPVAGWVVVPHTPAAVMSEIILAQSSESHLKGRDAASRAYSRRPERSVAGSEDAVGCGGC